MRNPDQWTDENIERSKSEVLELFNLTKKQLEELKSKIERFDGLIRIFIHPNANDNGRKIENQDRVYQIMSRTILSNEAPPIIIMENERDVWLWSQSIKETNPNNIYLVPTMLNYPYPVIPGEPRLSKKDEDRILEEKDQPQIEANFKKFITILEDLGVKKIFVGGTSLVIIDDITGCVGNFINHMRVFSKFEIKLSLGTAPLNRTDISEIDTDLL